MYDYVRQKADPLADCGMHILVRRCFERPVYEHRPSDYIFLGNKAPIAGVVTHVAVIAHGKITGRRYDNVIALNILGQKLLPVGKEAVVIRRWHGREIIAIIVRRFIAIVDDVRFIQLFPIAKHHAIAQMNTISGYADNPLDHVERGFRRRKKDDDVSASYLAIGKQRTGPACRRSELNSVYEDVVPDHQGVLHGAGRNFKSLQDKSYDE